MPLKQCAPLRATTARRRPATAPGRSIILSGLYRPLGSPPIFLCAIHCNPTLMVKEEIAQGVGAGPGAVRRSDQEAGAGPTSHANPSSTPRNSLGIVGSRQPDVAHRRAPRRRCVRRAQACSAALLPDHQIALRPVHNPKAGQQLLEHQVWVSDAPSQ
jgi:hypothetical protein